MTRCDDHHRHEDEDPNQEPSGFPEGMICMPPNESNPTGDTSYRDPLGSYSLCDMCACRCCGVCRRVSSMLCVVDAVSPACAWFMLVILAPGRIVALPGRYV